MPDQNSELETKLRIKTAESHAWKDRFEYIKKNEISLKAEIKNLKGEVQKLKSRISPLDRAP